MRKHSREERLPEHAASAHERRRFLLFGLGVRAYLPSLAAVLIFPNLMVALVPVSHTGSAGLLGVITIMLVAALVGAVAVFALAWEHNYAKSQQPLHRKTVSS
jgi:hypothetical protein